MKIIFTAMLAISGLSAQARTIDCYDEGARWTHTRVLNAGSPTANFEIMDAVDNAQDEIGGSATLRLVRIVRPRGERWLHYKGTFNEDFRQKTISLYVKEDLTALSRLLEEGDAVCY